MSKFSKDFIWGAATSSYQIEGAMNQDGKGLSIWDDFCRQTGKIADKSSGQNACDHYNRMESDVDLMVQMSLQAYRFSISWPRVLPQGTGAVNEKGLDFYDRLVDQLLAKGLKPFPTLYHWDLPLELHHQGGWTNKESPEWFAHYTQAVVNKLGDRVTHWTTLNEPHVFCLLGYQLGFHAPGHTSRVEYMKSIRNALLAHGLSAQIIHQQSSKHLVGIANSHLCLEAKTPQDEPVAKHMDAFTNRIYLDPIIHGTIPQPVATEMEKYGVVISSRDLQIIKQPLDFAGVNYYMRMLASYAPPEHPFPYMLEHPSYEGAQLTDMGWEVYPLGLQKVLNVYREDYLNIPTYITENGAAFADGPDLDGRVRDTRRIEYYHQHFLAMQRAIEQGCQVAGYFAWSLMDNFEWAQGYVKRFGLIHVDYEQNCRRTLKDSALWYRDWIKENT